MNSNKKIIIDARHLTKVIDGLGRYVLELINGLSNLPAKNIIILHTDEFPFEHLTRKESLSFYQVNIRGGHPKQHIFLPFIIRKLKADVYFYPFIDPPIFSPAKKNIFAVHDLNHFFFSKNAATENKIAILMAKVFIYLSSLIYDNVVVFSHFVKDQLNEYVRFSKNKTITIYHGYSPIDKENTVVSDRLIATLASFQKFILYVGNNRPHKNLKRLFEAFKLMNPDRSPGLIIAGNKITRFFDIDKAIRDSDLEQRIKRVNKPSNSDLACLYRQAEFVIYPSLSEGFGFPILESWAFHVPIVMSNTTCLPEIGGDAAYYFDPTNSKEMSEAMEKVFNDLPLRQILVKNGNSRLDGFTWEESAVKHLEVFLSER